MTLTQADAVFQLLIPSYFSVREEITTYSDYDSNEDRKIAIVCELYTTETTSDGRGEWFGANSWEEVITTYLEKLKGLKNV